MNGIVKKTAMTSMENLINAVIANDADKVQELLKNGLDPNGCEDEAMVTPLHFAAQHNAQTAAAILLWAGADIYALTSDGLSPSDVAEMHHFDDMVELLRRGKDVITH